MRVYCTKLFGRVVHSESKMSRSSNFRKKFVGIFFNFFLFGLRAVTSQIFAKKKTGLPSTVSEILKGEKHSHQKKIFPSVSEFGLMIFGLLAKKFGRLTKTALYVSRGVLRRKKLSKKIIFLHQFVNLCWWFSGFWRKMSQTSPKLHSTCPD